METLITIGIILGLILLSIGYRSFKNYQYNLQKRRENKRTLNQMISQFEEFEKKDYKNMIKSISESLETVDSKVLHYIDLIKDEQNLNEFLKPSDKTNTWIKKFSMYKVYVKRE